MPRRILLLGMLLLGMPAAPAAAQLNETFSSLFDTILRQEFELSPGPHAQHYFPAARLADSLLTPALTNLLANNVSSFPLSSTVAGVTFDFSTGQPVSIRESQGPIFAETAETLGRNKMIVGFNVTHLSLNRLRGLPLAEARFTFTHQDIEEPGLGDHPTETDVVHIALGLDANADIFAFFASYGLTRSLDVGVALPIISMSLQGTARATIDSYTLFIQDQFGGGARHFFGGSPQDPVLERTIPYEESTVGLGDVAVRLKYRFSTEGPSGLAALVDVRIPTGSQDDFLGTGSLNYRLALIGSTRVGDFTPHLNVGYSHRGADFDSDEVVFAAGFDQKITSGVTFALDVLGNFDLEREQTVRLLPGEATLFHRSPDTDAATQRTIPLSNIPDQDYDHTIDASMGFRIAASDRLQFLGNLIVPLQEGGLRSGAVPTVGLSVNF